MTGLPGWIRFGYSRWAGSPTTGPSLIDKRATSKNLLPRFLEPLRTRCMFPTASFQPIGTSRREEAQTPDDRTKAVEPKPNPIKRRLGELGKSPITQPPRSPYGYLPTSSLEEELASLEDYKMYLDEETKGVGSRIEELKSSVKRGPQRWCRCNMGPLGWSLNPYLCWGGCRRFHWLPWWAGIYGPITPYWIYSSSREDEIAVLEDKAKILERELERIKKRLEELKK